jgi:hypothetical protein
MVNGVGAAGKTNHYASPAEAEVRERVRRQTGVVLRDLKGLRVRVEGVGERAEGERWRRWVVGWVV